MKKISFVVCALLILYCISITALGSDNIGNVPEEKNEPILFDDGHGNVYTIRVPADQVEEWERQQAAREKASRVTPQGSEVQDGINDQESLSLYERSIKIATEEQRKLLEKARAECEWGAVGDCTRQYMQIMGQLDQNAPRLTLEQAKAVCTTLSARFFISSEAFEAYVVSVLNDIAGAPDYEGGSGIQRYIYYLDEEKTQQIKVMLGAVIYYDEASGENTVLYKY